MRARLLIGTALTLIAAAALVTDALAQYAPQRGWYGGPMAPGGTPAPRAPAQTNPVAGPPTYPDASGPSNATSPPVNAPTANGDTLPGMLTARDVVGKRLIDPNGLEIGRIESVSRDGQEAVVRGGGRRFTIPMSRLALGNGPNTVVASGQSAAEDLNRRELNMRNQ